MFQLKKIDKIRSKHFVIHVSEHQIQNNKKNPSISDLIKIFTLT